MRRWLVKVVPLAAVAAVIMAVVVIVHPASSGAAATTHTISFTGSGASPGHLTIADGDKILFRNDVDPTARVPVLGALTGILADVKVTVSGATVGDFTLDRGQQATVGPYRSGSSERQVPYTLTYHSRYLAGLIPGPTRTVHATITIEPPAR